MTDVCATVNEDLLHVDQDVIAHVTFGLLLCRSGGVIKGTSTSVATLGSHAGRRCGAVGRRLEGSARLPFAMGEMGLPLTGVHPNVGVGGPTSHEMLFLICFSIKDNFTCSCRGCNVRCLLCWAQFESRDVTLSSSRTPKLASTD